MCAHYRLTNSPSQIAVHLGITLDPDTMSQLSPRLNISVSQRVPIVRSDGGGRRLHMAEWGFRATWDSGKRIFNAMAETANRKPTFRDAFASRRCLLPADGFYEWPQKQMTLIHYQDDRVFCFGGLWQGDEVTMLTCAPNEFMQPIHRRMPVILSPDHYEQWLDINTPAAELKAMIGSRPWHMMKASPSAIA